MKNNLQYPRKKKSYPAVETKLIQPIAQQTPVVEYIEDLPEQTSELIEIPNPYVQPKNYTFQNIRYWFQGKWRKFIIKQYLKLNLPEDMAQKVVKYSKLLGSCPSCGCPMAEILLTNKECDE